MARTLVFVVERTESDGHETAAAVCATRSVAAGYAEYLTHRTGRQHGYTVFSLRETVPGRLPLRRQQTRSA